VWCSFLRSYVLQLSQSLRDLVQIHQTPLSKTALRSASELNQLARPGMYVYMALNTPHSTFQKNKWFAAHWVLLRESWTFHWVFHVPCLIPYDRLMALTRSCVRLCVPPPLIYFGVTRGFPWSFQLTLHQRKLLKLGEYGLWLFFFLKK
jgi:hypothetical protein